MLRNSSANAEDERDAGSIPGSGRSPGREDPLEECRQPTPALFPGESHGQRSLVG